MDSEPLFLHCRQCVESGQHAGVTALVFEGDLMIVCRNQEHGAVHIQPYVGPELRCGHASHGTPDRRSATGGKT